MHLLNHRDTLGTMVSCVYLIHSVLLDSILATKALGIVCRKENSGSENRRLDYWSGWGEGAEGLGDRHVKAEEEEEMSEVREIHG